MIVYDQGSEKSVYIWRKKEYLEHIDFTILELQDTTRQCELKLREFDQDIQRLILDEAVLPNYINLVLSSQSVPSNEEYNFADYLCLHDCVMKYDGSYNKTHNLATLTEVFYEFLEYAMDLQSNQKYLLAGSDDRRVRIYLKIFNKLGIKLEHFEKETYLFQL